MLGTIDVFMYVVVQLYFDVTPCIGDPQTGHDPCCVTDGSFGVGGSGGGVLLFPLGCMTPGQAIKNGSRMPPS